MGTLLRSQQREPRAGMLCLMIQELGHRAHTWPPGHQCVAHAATPCGDGAGGVRGLEVEERG